MTEIRLALLQGGAITLGSDAISALRQTLRGNVCLAEEPGYDEARTIWNAMIDRRPGADRALQRGGRRHAVPCGSRASTACCSRCAAAATTSRAMLFAKAA